MKEKIFDVPAFQNYISLQIKQYMTIVLKELAENKEFVRKVQEDKELSDPNLPKEKQQEKVEEFFKEFSFSHPEDYWEKVKELFIIDEEKLKTFIL